MNSNHTVIFPIASFTSYELMQPKIKQITRISRHDGTHALKESAHAITGRVSTPFGMKFPRSRGKHCLTSERNEDAESIYREKNEASGEEHGSDRVRRICYVGSYYNTPYS